MLNFNFSVILHLYFPLHVQCTCILIDLYVIVYIFIGWDSFANFYTSLETKYSDPDAQVNYQNSGAKIFREWFKQQGI